MVRSKVWVSLLGFCVAWSGCSATEGTPSDSSPGVSSTTPPSIGPSLFNADGSAPLPTLNVGDWWSYAVDYDSGESYDAKIVVHADDGTNYHITSDETELLSRSAFDHYPTFGAIRRSDFSHMIHGVPVPFLRFPLQNESYEASYRDFTGAFETKQETVSVAGSQLPGFTTTMSNAADGNVRLVNHYSPAVKYFTSFTGDFDGVAPPDVTFTLKEWGTNLTGPVPVYEITEGVHRPFPTHAVAPPNPAAPPLGAPEARGTFEVPAGTSLLVGMFAGAGGAGNFEFHLAQSSSAGMTLYYPWRPQAAASHFEWHEIEAPAAGQWDVIGAGAAQNFAFLFLETYAIKTNTVEL